MSDINVKVSQPGYSVETAADTQLLFNANWPLLKILHEGDYIIQSDTTQTIFTQNTGYFPAFFVCDASSGFSTTNPTLNLAIGVNKNELKYFTGTSGLTFPIVIHYYIYVLDLQSSFSAPIVKQSLPSATGSSDIEIKVSKPGKDVSSDDLRDFSIHSGTQSPMIHQIVSKITQTTNSSSQNINAVVANHNLGYVPLFFPFVMNSAGYYFFTGNFTQSTPRVFGTKNLIRIELSLAAVATYGACLIVFKDPYIIDIPTTVVSA